MKDVKEKLESARESLAYAEHVNDTAETAHYRRKIAALQAVLNKENRERTEFIEKLSRA